MTDTYYHWQCHTCGACMKSIDKQSAIDFANEHLEKTKTVIGHWILKKTHYHHGDYFEAGPEVGMWFQRGEPRP